MLRGRDTGRVVIRFDAAGVTASQDRFGRGNEIGGRGCGSHPLAHGRGAAYTRRQRTFTSLELVATESQDGCDPVNGRTGSTGPDPPSAPFARSRARASSAGVALLLSLSTLPVQARAQALVQGVVTDRGGGQALADATVRALGVPTVSRTGANGHYRLTSLSAGPIHLEAIRVGYERAVVDTTLPTTGTLVINFQLHATALRLDEITVTAAGQSNRHRRVARRWIA